MKSTVPVLGIAAERGRIMINVIRKEPTPNPNAFKYHTGMPLLEGGSLSFASSTEADSLALAKRLFQLTGVEAVFLSDDYVSVSATQDADWTAIDAQVEKELTSLDLEAVRNLARSTGRPSSGGTEASEGPGLYDQVNYLFDRYVRPALAGDGGGIELIDVEGKTVRVRYQGACGSCPTALRNTLYAIEQLLQNQLDTEIRVLPE
jgi:Fe-S cluster biogenesis protein NfuA